MTEPYNRYTAFQEAFRKEMHGISKETFRHAYLNESMKNTDNLLMKLIKEESDGGNKNE
jgi:hypothetical protein